MFVINGLVIFVNGILKGRLRTHADAQSMADGQAGWQMRSLADDRLMLFAALASGAVFQGSLGLCANSDYFPSVADTFSSQPNAVFMTVFQVLVLVATALVGVIGWLVTPALNSIFKRRLFVVGCPVALSVLLSWGLAFAVKQRFNQLAV